MRTSCSSGLIVAVGVVMLMAVTALPEDDLLSISIALGPRAEGLIMARCSVCHSADLITQQRIPPARWEATVDKMKHWGAEISEEEAGLLIRYLSARYHPGAPDRLPPLEHEAGTAEPLGQEPAPSGPLVGVAGRGSGIFEHNCQACHGQAGIGGIGPKLAKSPILKHEDLFWDTVLHGRGPMPAWGSILSEQDIADIHAWLLTR
ncbi:MAG TPA: c-type cytochrome [Nitrospira sp.]|nr:c-type cytochrome [Nitrospira sp.]